MTNNDPRDLEHLRVLSIFHYVVAALTAVVSLIPLLHLGFGVAMLSGALDSDADRVPRVLAWGMVLIPALIIALGLTCAAVIVRAGRCLAARRSYTFCIVIAGLLCLMMPYGTVLGVFTIIVLMRDSVRRLFEH